ncbi:ANTAR domain-containing protein [Hamadaea tsunoensis]|uniref:ANTAR domain-containing protein n=1 Tax=Hamadaea tsunoensis TaxID=53368 RepID=UPI00041B0BC2|nr:ANTAR domain-containing protein [Hamadaea tsunoensis]
MTAQRRIRLWTRVVEVADGGRVTLGTVCTALIEAAGVDGAWASVLLPANLRETVYASDAVAERLSDLALTLGEGPGVDASGGTPALAADLLDIDSQARWPVFAPAAVQVGARALFALPLQVGTIQVGVLDLYRAAPGSLDDDQLADALLLADTACAILLDAGGMDIGSASRPHLDAHHPEVHQATGMLIVQLRVTASVALVRLRAYAYAHDLPLRDVARSVVARRLRFSPDPDIGDGGLQ